MSEGGDWVRCGWVAHASDLDIRYHDEEWGVPKTGDAALFEAISLEGAQAGLSWATILKKRDGYRQAFNHFDPASVSEFGPDDVERLVLDPGIVRHRGKIESVVNNARRILEIQESEGSFSSYVWSFVDQAPVQNAFDSLKDLPSTTDTSKRLSKDLKKRGFRFVGPTTVYAFMQATGMVNDHQTSCFRYAQVAAMADSLKVGPS